jgi:hypothetical protein
MGQKDFDRTTLIHLLEDEKKAWLDIATVLEDVKNEVLTNTTKQSLTDRARECRSRSEAIRRMVARIAEQSLTAE